MVLAVFAYLFSGTVVAIDLRVVAPNAVREVVSETAARYERVSGNRTVLTWGGSEAIAKRVANGDVFDIVLNTPQNLEALVKAGKIAAGSRVDFTKSGIGVAVRGPTEARCIKRGRTPEGVA